MPTPPYWQGVRVRLSYKDADGFLAGNRFYLAYSGSAPTGGNCVTLAGDIGSDWAAHLAPQITTEWQLYEVDIVDLASEFGASGTDTTLHNATRSPPEMPSQTCVNVEFDIARRYRGGKPRIYLPSPDTGAQLDNSHWSGAFITQENTAVAAFFAAVTAHAIGSMGTLTHVAVSYFKGYDTTRGHTTAEGTVYPPKYRDSVVTDPVVGYATKSVIGSQRRRRTATSP